MTDDYTANSHYFTYTYLVRKVWRMYFFNLEVINAATIARESGVVSHSVASFNGQDDARSKP